MGIKYLTYEIAADCNMDCGFCFSDWRGQSAELETDTAKRAIQAMVDQGLEALNLTGGEPLLRPDIGDILRYSKDLGLTTILSTNGILLENRLHEISDYVDYIGLPIDSGRESVHNYLRPTKSTENHHGLIVGLVDKLHNDYNDIGVKINTLVSNVNADSIVDIGDIINGKVISWKLSQFIPSGHGAQFEKRYNITKSNYVEIVHECRAAYPGMNIVDSVAHERDDCCRIISSDGHLLRPTLTGLVDMGDIRSLTQRDILRGLNQPKNEYVLSKTYRREK